MCDPQLCLKRNSLALILFNFHVTAIGGSLFLFDRKVLRYFRKDGHNWRKKKDGKTVKEAHEKLKVSNWLETPYIVVTVDDGISVSFWHGNLLLYILYHFDIARNLNMFCCGRILFVSNCLYCLSIIDSGGGKFRVFLSFFLSFFLGQLTPYFSSISALSFFFFPLFSSFPLTPMKFLDSKGGSSSPLNPPLIIDCCVQYLWYC